jgi:GTP-binding protein HflX
MRRRLLPEGRPGPQPRGVAVSARTGQGIDALLAAVDEVLPFDPIVPATFRVPPGEGASISLLHELGRVKATRYEDSYTEIEAEVPESLKQRLARYIV